MRSIFSSVRPLVSGTPRHTNMNVKADNPAQSPNAPASPAAFTSERKDNSEINVYIQSATLNGQPLSRPLLAHADLGKGGKLVLQMGPQPNRSWGVGR